MFRMVFWAGRTGMGFGMLGTSLILASIIASSFAFGRATKKKRSA